MTYAELLGGLKALVARDAGWQRTHAQQNFFINQLIDHFVEVPGAVSSDDRIAFIKTMCETGESTRYGYRPQESAAQEFADLVAQHAKRQFEEGRRTLANVKRALKGYAEQTLVGQVNGALSNGHIISVQARFVGQWEWAVTLRRADWMPTVFLEFGPTAVAENGLVPEPLVDPDYTKIFVTRQAAEGDGLDLILQSSVGLDDVLAGLSSDDTRLREAVLAAVGPN